MTELLYETARCKSDSIRIDRDSGILFGVKIIGCESKNRRLYPNDTLRDAIPLYENSKVNLDHPDGDPCRPRSYHARFGMIKNVHLKENEGLFADFWFNPKHPLAEQFLWDAEHAPENVGFSHNVEAKVNHKNEPALVEQIVAVRSVDLVADPAATQGLFESTEFRSHSSPITFEQAERLIEDRLQQFKHTFTQHAFAQRETAPQCREQIVTETNFDSKAFAAALQN